MLIEILLNLNLTSGSSKILLYLQFQINEFNNIFYLHAKFIKNRKKKLIIYIIINKLINIT